MKLKDIGEFGLIDLISNKFSDLIPAGATGIGDDCAVIPISNDSSLLVTTDMLLENIHFLIERITPYELGRKSLAVNLSDISAMGGKPYAAFLSLALPADTDPEWVKEFMEGIHSHNIPLLGGDTTKSVSGIAINIAAMGFAAPESIKYRSCAKTGDKVMVTGNLGDSAAGLKAIFDGISLTKDTESLICAHNNPLSYVKSGEWLGRQVAVHAMIDISDGLASDIGHIIKASKAGARIDIDKLPLSEALIKVSKDNRWNYNSLSIEGGEDYVLMLTVDKNHAESLKTAYLNAIGSPLFEIGEITDSGKLEWLSDGKILDENFRGFDHF